MTEKQQQKINKTKKKPKHTKRRKKKFQKKKLPCNSYQMISTGDEEARGYFLSQKNHHHCSK